MKSLKSVWATSCLLVIAANLEFANCHVTFAQATTVGTQVQDGAGDVVPGGAGAASSTSTSPAPTTTRGATVYGFGPVGGTGPGGAVASQPSASARYRQGANTTQTGTLTAETVLGLATGNPFPQTFAGLYASSSEQQNNELMSALAAWKDASTDEAARGNAKEKASQALASIYDELLNGQEQEIDELEKRVVELREQLSRRRQAKAKMVELKLEMMLSQTDGLGWPSPESRSPFLRPSQVIGTTPLPGMGIAPSLLPPSAPATIAPSGIPAFVSQ